MTKDRAGKSPAYNNYSRKRKKNVSSDGKRFWDVLNHDLKEDEDEQQRKTNMYDLMPMMEFGGMPMYDLGSPAPVGMQNYGPPGMPVSAQQNPNYGQLPVNQMLAGQAEGLKTSEYNPANLAQVNVQYTSPCGTIYTLGVTAPQASEGTALDNMLGGLYGIMASESYNNRAGSSKGKPYAGGKSRNYAGSKSGYGGGKASSSAGGK